MRKKETPHQQFEKEIINRYEALIKDYTTKINKPQDGYKERVHNRFLHYAREEYEVIQKSLNEYVRFIIDIEDECGEENKRFDLLFNEKYESLTKVGKNIILKKHTQLKAFDKMFGYLATEGKKYQPVSSSQHLIATSSIKWKGTVEIEFIQLIYALHEAGYLGNEESEITKLVKQVANVFNYNLGDHWQSNLSDSVNSRNADYQPKIFEKLVNAFATYREKQIEINKKKKPK